MFNYYVFKRKSFERY